jgi:hypothetical protein
MTTKLKSAAQKHAPKKPENHGLDNARLMEIHRKERQPGWSWATAPEIKERLSISGHTLGLLHQRYGLPQLVADGHSKPAYSLVALEHILETVPEMISTSAQDTNRDRLEQIKQEAEDEVREKLRSEFEAKITANA